MFYSSTNLLWKFPKHLWVWLLLKKHQYPAVLDPQEISIKYKHKLQTIKNKTDLFYLFIYFTLKILY